MPSYDSSSNYPSALSVLEAEKIKQKVHTKQMNQSVAAKGVDPTEDAKLASNKIIEKANSKAEEILLNAENKAKKIATDRASIIVNNLTKDANENYKLSADLIKNLKLQNEELIQKTNDQVKKLTLIALDRIVGEARIEKFYACAVENIMNEFLDIHSITVRMNEDDYTRVKSYIEQDKALKRLSHINLKHDHSLTAGTCFLETNAGDFAVSINQHLKKIFNEVGM